MSRIFFIISIIITIACYTDAKGPNKDLGTVIGIDLGTTYTCVGIFKNRHVEIIQNDQGNRITPSYVAFTSDGERLIGDDAKNLLTANPKNTIFHIKRLIGRKFNESSVQKDIKNFPFSVIEKNNEPVIKVNTDYGEKIFTPEEISAMILGNMKTIAEAYLGQKVKNAVVTVPAYFNNAQRQATKDAGTIAGLNVLRIINEPTAAAIAYGWDKLNPKEGAKNILVFDLGGGTFDVSLLTLDNGVFEVLAANGNTHLGGEDFNQRVIDYFIELFKTKTKKYAGKNIRSVRKLRREVEKAKRALSSQHQTKIEIESFFQNEDLNEILTRAKFEELNNDLFQSTLIPVEEVMKDTALQKSDIADVFLVGGSTRIPKVRQILKEYFNGKVLSRSLNPDEAVAYGAAIQGGILSGEDCTGDIVILDINPFTLGIKTIGGVMSKLIARSSCAIMSKTKTFTTTFDNQESVGIEIYEGEQSMTKDNHFLGRFDLTGIPPAPRGASMIDVTFDTDENGILKVTAEDKSTGIRKHIIINSTTNRFSTQEIDQMVKEEEEYPNQDLEPYAYLVKNKLADETKISPRDQIVIEHVFPHKNHFGKTAFQIYSDSSSDSGSDFGEL